MRGPARRKEQGLSITSINKMSNVTGLRTPGGPPPGLDRTRTGSGGSPTTGPSREPGRGKFTVYRKSTCPIPRDPYGMELDHSSGLDDQTGISQPLTRAKVHQELRTVSGLQRELKGGWVHNFQNITGVDKNKMIVEFDLRNLLFCSLEKSPTVDFLL